MPYNSIRSARRPALGARLARLYVRSVSRSTAFSSAQALPSRSSAGGCPPLFGPFAGTTAQSDSSAAYTWGVRHAPSPTGLPLGGRASPRSPGSRAESFLTCTSSSTAPGPLWPSPPVNKVGPRDELFHGSIVRPASASVNASPAMSPPPAHDSRSTWFAAPSLWGSFLPDSPPVYPGAF